MLGRPKFKRIPAKRIPVQAVLLFIGGFHLAVVYNACSEVKFSTEVGMLKNELNSVAAIVINDNADYTNSQAVKLSITNPLAKEMYVTNAKDCSSGGAWEPYSYNKPWALSEANKLTGVYVKFRIGGDSAVESECVSDAIIHDDVPPVIEITRPAPAIWGMKTLQIDFKISDNLSGIKESKCVLADGNVVACSNGLLRTDLAEGPQAFTVHAVDKAGNESIPVPQSWLVDLTPPVVTINKAPSAITSSTTAVLEFSATDNLTPITRFECKLDGAADFSQCASPMSYSNLPAGQHSFQVRAFDSAGHASEVKRADWKIDLSAPTVEITKTPGPFTNDPGGKFEFRGDDGGTPIANFECSYDSGAFKKCTSPTQSSTPLAEGEHTFAVIGIDDVGNKSAPATYTWKIDLTGPTVKITKTPDARTKESSAHFEFLATDAGSGVSAVECSLDGAAFKACSSMTQQDYSGLASGKHTFHVRAKDVVGNVSDPEKSKYEWVIDLKAPVVKITSGPTQPFSGSQSARFTISAVDEDGGTVSEIQCQRETDPSFVKCGPEVLYSSLSEGRHQLVARAIDSVGNVSAPTDAYVWNVDLTPPVINFTRTPLAEMSFVDPSRFEYNLNDGTGSGVDPNSLECVLDGKKLECSLQAGRLDIPAQAVGNHTFVMKARDMVGNSSEKSYTWKAVSQLQFPTINKMASIAFEDWFDKTIDEDYNDNVVDFNIIEDVNNQMQVTKITMDFIPAAFGSGSYDHALKLVMDGEKDAPTTLTKKTRKMFEGGARVKLTHLDMSGNVIESWDNLPIDKDVDIFPNSRQVWMAADGKPLYQVNVGNDGKDLIKPARKAKLEITLNDPTLNPIGSRTRVQIDRYRIVLKVLTSGIEGDLIDVDPTAHDARGFPYGFVIPSSWKHMKEQKKIGDAYPRFKDYMKWLLDNGGNANSVMPPELAEWYEYLPAANEGLVYSKPRPY